MNISEKGVEAIKLFEGCNRKGDLHHAYKCSAGVWTCGFGSTGGVTATTIWTDDQAKANLLRDLMFAENAVRKQCGATKLKQHEYDACVSFVFNLGPRPAATLWKKIVANDILGAGAEFPRWDQVNGKPNEGVRRRRLAEQAIFLNGRYPESW
jgi:lysozyme